jgi:hypothetical protein
MLVESALIIVLIESKYNKMKMGKMWIIIINIIWQKFEAKIRIK